jgi:ribonuclease BN (tRNA processing enzyme)
LEKISFKAIILGSGTILPSLEKSSCSVLLKIGSTHLVLDTGPGTIRRLLRTNTSIFNLSYICYSHFHPDHIADLVPLLFGTKYPDATLQKHPMTLIGGKGFKKFYNHLKAAYGDWMTPEGNWLTIKELSDEMDQLIHFNDFDLHTAAMTHRPESQAYRVQLSDGRSVVYSGDTDYCENLIRLSDRTDLLICECSMPDAMKVSGHLTPSLAGIIATQAKAKRLLLTHLYPECCKVDIVAQAQNTYTGPITVAEDLMTIEV